MNPLGLAIRDHDKDMGIAHVIVLHIYMNQSHTGELR